MKKLFFTLVLLAIFPIIINDAYSILPLEGLVDSHIDMFMLVSAACVGGLVFFIMGKLKSKNTTKPENNHEKILSDSKTINNEITVSNPSQTKETIALKSSSNENKSCTLYEFLKPNDIPATIDYQNIPSTKLDDPKISRANASSLPADQTSNHGDVSELNNEMIPSVNRSNLKTDSMIQAQPPKDMQNSDSIKHDSKVDDDTPYVIRSVLNSIDPISKKKNFEAFQSSELKMSITWLQQLVTKKLTENPNSKVKYEQELVKIINDEILLRAEESDEKTVFDVPLNSITKEELEKIQPIYCESIFSSKVQNYREITSSNNSYLDAQTPAAVNDIIKLIDTTTEHANFAGIITEDLRISYDWLHNFMSKKLQEDQNASINYEIKLMNVINDEIRNRCDLAKNIQFDVPAIKCNKKVPPILDLITKTKKRKRSFVANHKFKSESPSILELIAKAKKRNPRYYQNKSKIIK